MSEKNKKTFAPWQRMGGLDCPHCQQIIAQRSEEQIAKKMKALKKAKGRPIRYNNKTDKYEILSLQETMRLRRKYPLKILSERDKKKLRAMGKN